MAIRNPTDLKTLLAPGERLMGLDVGTKTIGIAFSDTLVTIATPYETLRRGKFRDDGQSLARLRRERGAGAIVLGLPINMDGSEGPRCQATRQFAANLLAIEDMTLVFWDERMSTMAVTRGMIEADLSRKRRAELVDKAAAAYILQGVLDRLAYMPTPSHSATIDNAPSDETD
ncbi:MAG TPA: Holliday junction resolvase RuvX [Stellaceae bacterium]|nr:Holliday junction resolvase RuvX [Stellaceae bacterium]